MKLVAPAVNIPQYKGPMPEHDVEEDENIPHPLPTAPPMEQLTKVAGYEHISFGEGAYPHFGFICFLWLL